jgi:hypothetical protein
MELTHNFLEVSFEGSEPYFIASRIDMSDPVSVR